MNTQTTRIPVTIVTGFLGSGKTTLLNHVLNGAHGKRIAIIENEFGEVSIDDALLVESNQTIFKMSNGCLCCTINGDLVRTLTDLIARRSEFDYVIIETTGVANPAPVVQTFMVNEEIAEAFALDAVVTTIDAKHIGEHIENKECKEQVAFADILILNKLDLVTTDEAEAVVTKLRSLNGLAVIHRTARSNIALDAILDQQAFSSEAIGHDHDEHGHDHKGCGHDHDGETCDHDHGHLHSHHHDDDVPAPPLARDLAAEQKRLRLAVTAAHRDLDLDLRQPLDRERSCLLHRLRLLDLPWGEPRAGAPRGRGTFHEHWQLAWRPEFAIALIEAGRWGQTLAAAAAARALDAITRADGLAGLVDWLDRVLLAELPEAATALLSRVRDAAAQSGDVDALLDALPPLARLARYGDARERDAQPFLDVLRALLARIAINLPAAATGLDDEAAAALFGRVDAVESALVTLADEAAETGWRTALQAIAELEIERRRLGRTKQTMGLHTITRIGAKRARGDGPIDEGACQKVMPGVLDAVIDKLGESGELKQGEWEALRKKIRPEFVRPGDGIKFQAIFEPNCPRPTHHLHLFFHHLSHGLHNNKLNDHENHLQFYEFHSLLIHF